MTSSKSGILLLNLGGPGTQEEVQPFLFNLFSDPDLIRLPFPKLQPLFAWIISHLRARKSKRNYAAIGGGSPLLTMTNAQARALQDDLVNRGFDVPVYVGMRYWHPLTESVVQQIKADGITHLVVLPLYPQYSISTTGSSFRLLETLWRQDLELAKIHLFLINSWYDQKDYLEAMALGIQTQLEQYPDPDRVHVLFSAHGVPEEYVTRYGDPYQQEMEACVQLIWKRVQRINPFSLAYQSRVGPIRWLNPYTEDVIPQLGTQGVKQLLVVPISFVSDHIETLEEIDIEYRHLAQACGIETFRRVPALNTDPGLIQAMVKLITPYLRLSPLEGSGMEALFFNKNITH
jgi:ferrochelatase